MSSRHYKTLANKVLDEFKLVRRVTRLLTVGGNQWPPLRSDFLELGQYLFRSCEYAIFPKRTPCVFLQMSAERTSSPTYLA